MINRIPEIRERIEAALNPTQLEIIDDSHKHIGHAGAAGGGGHYTVKISSAVFSGKSRLEQHRLIYAALGELMDREIHALRIKVSS